MVKLADALLSDSTRLISKSDVTLRYRNYKDLKRKGYTSAVLAQRYIGCKKYSCTRNFHKKMIYFCVTINNSNSNKALLINKIK